MYRRRRPHRQPAGPGSTRSRSGWTPNKARGWAPIWPPANRRMSSIFGPAEGVLGIWSSFRHAHRRAFDVRPDQPLLELRGHTGRGRRPAGAVFAPRTILTYWCPPAWRCSRKKSATRRSTGGGQHYRQRVATLIRKGHSLIRRDGHGQVVFKAELGNVSADAVQIQGVWVNPRLPRPGPAAGVHGRRRRTVAAIRPGRQPVRQRLQPPGGGRLRVASGSGRSARSRPCCSRPVPAAIPDQGSAGGCCAAVGCRKHARGTVD